MEKKYDVFISYRREGGEDIARFIQQALNQSYRVFLDFDELDDGVFDKRIMDAIDGSTVFLLVLSKGALDRCVNEDDWVRKEIIHASKCSCHIVPVTINDTFEGLPEDLPDELRSVIGAHQFSELQTRTLFEESINKLVRNRIEPYVHREDERTVVSGLESEEQKKTRRLSASLFLSLYVFLGGVCCYYCAESLYLLLPINSKLMIGMLVVAFFIILSYGMVWIANSINANIKVEHRTRSYFLGVGLTLLYGFVCLMPLQTHALYYRFEIGGVLHKDIETTRNYLSEISRDGENRQIQEEINFLADIEQSLELGELHTNSKEDMELVDARLRLDYALIRDNEGTQYANIGDQIHYSANPSQTHIGFLRSVVEVWKRQIQKGFSMTFLLAMLISSVLIILSVMFFIKAFDSSAVKIPNGPSPNRESPVLQGADT